MARIRTIKPSIWGDAKFASLSRDARLLTVGLISSADDAGRFLASPSAISGYVYPHDDVTAGQVKRWRDEIARSGLIDLYRVDGRDYGVFPNWRRHQRISKPQPSSFPEPPHRPLRNHSAPERGTAPQGKGRERKGREETPVGAPRSEANARDPNEGSKTSAAADAAMFRQLVDDVALARPAWSGDAIADAARMAYATRGANWPDVRDALLAVAALPDSTSPGRVRLDGPWWHGSNGIRPASPPAGRPETKPLADVIADLPEADPERNARGRAAARATLAKAKPEPEASP